MPVLRMLDRMVLVSAAFLVQPGRAFDGHILSKVMSVGQGWRTYARAAAV